MKQNTAQLAFNRGMISKLALARLDIKRTALSAEIQTNWMPRVLGSMMLRPGLAYIGTTESNNAAVHLPFIFSSDDTAIIELTASKMRVRVSDTIIARASVSTTIANGTFATVVTSWTDDDDAGAVSAWLTGGYLSLLGNGTAYAKRYQTITVVAGDQGVEHALRVVIQRGPVELKVGTTAGTDNYISATLGTGEHSLALTPTGNFVIQFQSRASYSVLVDSVAIEAVGDMEVTTPWGASDLENVRSDQSGDILFCACNDTQQYKIERRSTRSWSVVKYETTDGPFRLINTGATTLATSAISGNVTITASAALFEAEHIGALFSISSTGQLVEKTIAAEDTWSDPIRITGITSSRIFTIIRAAVSDSTVTLQRSVEEVGDWEDVTTYTSNATLSYDDALDNQIVYYRIGVKTGDLGAGDLASGDIALTLRYSSGSITGIARVTAVASGTSASAVVLKSFGGTTASDDWSEGEWSDHRGWPTAVAFYEGRLFWAGKDKIIGSVSDSFYSFDETYEGDAAPINRSIGSGPVDNINWLVPAKTLLVGGEGSIKSARSSSLEEPLTPTNFNLKDIATQGAANVAAIRVDNQMVFIQASAVRAYEIAFDAAAYDYASLDLTALVPEIGEPSIIKVVVQRQPDTREHFIRSDGKVAVMIYDKVEDVKCWILVETDGSVEDAVVLPGSIEDSVYYLVNRTIDGSTVRYLEKWTLESYGKGETDSRLADSHLIYSGVSTVTITGLTHLEGESVVVWGNTKDLGTYIVASGSITLSEAVTWCCVGLAYTADFKSSKPTLAANMGVPLSQKKYISELAVILADTHAKGLTYGPDFDHLDDLPEMEHEVSVDGDYIWPSYDNEAFTFPGAWDTDSRLCLRATAPRPCTILAAIMSWNMHETG